jgi:hypothetical protein
MTDGIHLSILMSTPQEDRGDTGLRTRKHLIERRFFRNRATILCICSMVGACSGIVNACTNYHRTFDVRSDERELQQRVAEALTSGPAVRLGFPKLAG